MNKPKKGKVKAAVKGVVRSLKPADKATRTFRKAEKAYKKSIEKEFDVKMKKGGSTDGKWIQKATESIKRRGTEGVCTGSNFGGPSCPPGSKRYNLAKTFKKMAKKK
jgi:hypothetical protein